MRSKGYGEAALQSFRDHFKQLVEGMNILD